MNKQTHRFEVDGNGIVFDVNAAPKFNPPVQPKILRSTYDFNTSEFMKEAQQKWMKAEMKKQAGYGGHAGVGLFGFGLACMYSAGPGGAFWYYLCWLAAIVLFIVSGLLLIMAMWSKLEDIFFD